MPFFRTLHGLSRRQMTTGSGHNIDLTNLDPADYEGQTVYSDYQGFPTQYLSNGTDWVPMIGADRFGNTASYTVGPSPSADFPDINTALTLLSRFRPAFAGLINPSEPSLRMIEVELVLESGFVIDEQIAVDGEDFGWIVIKSVDAEVPLDASGFYPRYSAAADADPVYAAIYGTNNAILPRIGTLIRCIDPSVVPNLRGMTVVQSSYYSRAEVVDHETSGLIIGLANFHTNFTCYQGFASLAYMHFYDSVGPNVQIGHGATVTMSRNRVYNAGQGGASPSNGIDNVNVFSGGMLTMLGTDFQSLPGSNNGRGIADCRINAGGFVIVRDSSLTNPVVKTYAAKGGTNIPPNSPFGLYNGDGVLIWDGYVYQGDNSGIETDYTINVAAAPVDTYTKGEVDALLAGAAGLQIEEDATTARTLTAADEGKYIAFTSGSPVTVTLPSFAAGFQCVIRQKGAGQITFAADPGVTILPAPGYGQTTSGQGAFVNVIYDAADEVGIKGDLEAA